VRHIICCCEALARERYVFWKLFVEPKDISTASVRYFCLFIRGTGLLNLCRLECLGLYNKPKAEVHQGQKLTGPKEEDGTDRVFEASAQKILDTGESPKRKNTTLTWRKFEIKKVIFFHILSCLLLYHAFIIQSPRQLAAQDTDTIPININVRFHMYQSLIYMLLHFVSFWSPTATHFT
jgi:hypothetical protein